MKPVPTDRWLAYELHDGLMQWIIGARLQLVAALVRESDLPVGSRANVRKALTSLEVALEEGRELVGYLEHERWQAGTKFFTQLNRFIEASQHEAQQQGQTITVECDAEVREQCELRLTDAISWNLLRIVQQAIRNAMQHAGPTPITVSCSVATEPETLVMSIADNGCGFDPQRPASESNHFGLNSMAHRARLIAAHLTIDSQAGAGCRIECRLPLP